MIFHSLIPSVDLDIFLFSGIRSLRPLGGIYWVRWYPLPALWEIWCIRKISVLEAQALVPWACSVWCFWASLELSTPSLFPCLQNSGASEGGGWYITSEFPSPVSSALLHSKEDQIILWDWSWDIHSHNPPNTSSSGSRTHSQLPHPWPTIIPEAQSLPNLFFLLSLLYSLLLRNTLL